MESLKTRIHPHACLNCEVEWRELGIYQACFYITYEQARLLKCYLCKFLGDRAAILAGSPVNYASANKLQEIVGIKISLIYNFLDQQQVSDLSHIGLLSSGIHQIHKWRPRETAWF